MGVAIAVVVALLMPVALGCWLGHLLAEDWKEWSGHNAEIKRLEAEIEAAIAERESRRDFKGIPRSRT